MTEESTSQVYIIYIYMYIDLSTYKGSYYDDRLELTLEPSFMSQFSSIFFLCMLFAVRGVQRFVYQWEGW